jgi:putative FmdB family regulatory protein
MPVYEYTCLKCGKNFELLIRGDTKVACPDCETTRVERRMSLPARPGGGGNSLDFSSLGPPGGSGCGGGSCGCH